MGRPKSSKNKTKGIKKMGVSLRDGSTPFTMGLDKAGSLDKTATGEYQVTQSQSFFYSPELNIMGS
jgi:hypothetical protein